MSQEKKKPAVYIAARMRGVQYFNFPAFDTARDRLERLGVTALSPADMDRADGFDAMSDKVILSLPTVVRGVEISSDWSHIPGSFDLPAAIERDNKAIDDPATVAIYVIHEGIAESAGGMAEIERGMKAGKIILFDTMDDAQILKALGMSETVEAPPTTGEVRYTDPTTGGQKGDKLARHDLLPPDIVNELAEHYGKGARKYADRNMEKGYPWSKSYAACHRHLNAFWQGENVDPEMGSLHLIAAAWHCFTMAWFLRHNKGTDDRPKV